MSRLSLGLRDPYVDRDIPKVSEIQLLLSFKYLGSVNSSEFKKRISPKNLEQHCHITTKQVKSTSTLLPLVFSRALDKSTPASV